MEIAIYYRGKEKGYPQLTDRQWKVMKNFLFVLLEGHYFSDSDAPPEVSKAYLDAKTRYSFRRFQIAQSHFTKEYALCAYKKNDDGAPYLIARWKNGPLASWSHFLKDLAWEVDPLSVMIPKGFYAGLLAWFLSSFSVPPKDAVLGGIGVFAAMGALAYLFNYTKLGYYRWKIPSPFKV